MTLKLSSRFIANISQRILTKSQFLRLALQILLYALQLTITNLIFIFICKCNGCEFVAM